MRILIFATAIAATLLVSASGAHAQIGRGPSLGDLGGPGGLGLSPLNSGPEFGARPSETMPMPQLPTQQWVPPQQEYDPAIGREIYVPPHYADRTPNGGLIQPPMTVPGPNGRPVFLPGGENPVPGIAP